MRSDDADVSRPEVSVIVVTHNNESLIGACLEAIDRGVTRHSHETILVDNASSDATRAVARATATRPQVIELKSNTGFAAATNVGIDASRGRLLALVNSDAFPDPGSIDRLADAIHRIADAGIVGGRLRYPDGGLQPSLGRFPSLVGGLWVALGLHRAPLLGRLDVGVSAHPALYRTRRRVDWVTGAFCMARREVGRLPERSFMYGEDVEWALSCRERGLGVWFEPAATAVHIGRASVDSSQRAGYAQGQRVRFELAWFNDRGRAVLIGARLVLIAHALTRLVVQAAGRLIPSASTDTFEEYLTLLKDAARPRGAFGD